MGLTIELNVAKKSNMVEAKIVFIIFSARKSLETLKKQFLRSIGSSNHHTEGSGSNGR